MIGGKTAAEALRYRAVSFNAEIVRAQHKIDVVIRLCVRVVPAVERPERNAVSGGKAGIRKVLRHRGVGLAFFRGIQIRREHNGNIGKMRLNECGNEACCLHARLLRDMVEMRVDVHVYLSRKPVFELCPRAEPRH